jgi:hypothetical protein
VRDLAHAAEVSLSTVRRFERGGAVRVSTAETIQRTIERPASSTGGTDAARRQRLVTSAPMVPTGRMTLP